MSSKKKTAVALSPRRNGLSKAARELLARVKVAASPEVIFGLEPAMAAAKVQSVVGPMIEGAGLPVALLQEYRWYVGELCRLMRTMSGPDLAYCMERAITKWLSLGLEPNTVVFLAGALFDRLQARPETEGDSPLRHQDTKGSESENAEVRNQIPEGRSADADGETAKDAKTAKPEPDGIQPQRHEDTKSGETDEVRSDKLDARSQKCGIGGELTTKTQRHQEDSESGTGPLALSDRGRGGQRGTDNEPTGGGGGP